MSNCWEIYEITNMGRRSKGAQAKRKAKPNKATKKSKKSENGKYSVDQLLDQAESCLDQFNYELAEKFCERALQSEPDSVRALELTGTVRLERDDMEGAKQCFNRAIELEPDDGYSKYMYMGQLVTDSEAAKCFLKGIALMKQQLDASGNEKTGAGDNAQDQAGAEAQPECPVTVRDISSAYCSVAEIYMTDACFEEDAETQCKHSLDQAVEIDPNNAEVHHLLASFHLSLDDAKSAESCMEKGLDLWLPQMREAEKAAEQSKVEFDPVQACSVSYPARVNAVKIVIELKKYEVAVEVLELLLDEDDTVVEVWYLLGWANYLQGEDYKANARYYLNKANKVAAQTGCEDQDLCAHVEELLQELGPGEGDNSDEETEAGEMDMDSSDEEGDEKDRHKNNTEESNDTQLMEH